MLDKLKFASFVQYGAENVVNLLLSIDRVARLLFVLKSIIVEIDVLSVLKLCNLLSFKTFTFVKTGLSPQSAVNKLPHPDISTEGNFELPVTFAVVIAGHLLAVNVVRRLTPVTVNEVIAGISAINRVTSFG